MDLDNNFTRIPNELIEAFLRFDMSKREQKIFWAVARKTFGWGKVSDDIANRQLANATGFHIQHVRSTLKSMQAKKIIVVTEGIYGREIGINTATDEWLLTEPEKYKETKTVPKGNQNSSPNSELKGTKTEAKGTKTVPRREPKRFVEGNQNGSQQKIYIQKKLPKETNTKKRAARDGPDTVCEVAENTPNDIELVINYLNEKTGKKFKPAKSNSKFITARLREGHTTKTLCDVIDLKCAEWLTNPKMVKYLRPATLFNEEKFSQYVGEIGSKPKTQISDKDFIDSLFEDSDDFNDVIDGEVLDARFG